MTETLYHPTTPELAARSKARCHWTNGHTRRAGRKGASSEEIMEAIWVAAEMRAGGADGHVTLACGRWAQHCRTTMS